MLCIITGGKGEREDKVDFVKDQMFIQYDSINKIEMRIFSRLGRRIRACLTPESSSFGQRARNHSLHGHVSQRLLGNVFSGTLQVRRGRVCRKCGSSGAPNKEVGCCMPILSSAPHAGDASGFLVPVCAPGVCKPPPPIPPPSVQDCENSINQLAIRTVEIRRKVICLVATIISYKSEFRPNLSL